MSEHFDPSAARRNLAVLVAAQALLGSQLPAIFVIGGLAGQSLAWNACLATLPISMIVLGSMATATPLSLFMQRFGRMPGFLLGACGGALGGLTGAAALWTGSFALLLVSGLLTGVYMSSQGFLRFAATDRAPEAFRPKAISYVMAAGLVSALIGPAIVRASFESMVVPFLGTYLFVAALNLAGACLYFFLDLPPPRVAEASAKGRSRADLLRTPPIAVAIIVAMVSYALMNLVMTSTPLAVVGCGFGTRDAANIVSGHVLAMFAPSFFTGHLILRFGVRRIMATGLTILALAGGVALSGVELMNFYVALVLLGLGWNFAFIGATTMLASSHTAEEKGRVQGLNDTLVFGCVTLASLASGGLMNCTGGSPVEGWTAVNMAMAPLLALAGGALIWLWLGLPARTRV